MYGTNQHFNSFSSLSSTQFLNTDVDFFFFFFFGGGGGGGEEYPRTLPYPNIHTPVRRAQHVFPVSLHWSLSCPVALSPVPSPDYHTATPTERPRVVMMLSPRQAAANRTRSGENHAASLQQNTYNIQNM